MPERFHKSIVALILCLATASSAVAATPGLKVERSRTRIGIARVVLNIDHLTLTDQGLKGDYAIRIPMAPFMDDFGTIQIPVTARLQDAIAPGNTLRGTASSREDGRTHEVACTFTDDKNLRIVVTTPDRILSFEAPYTVQN